MAALVMAVGIFFFTREQPKTQVVTTASGKTAIVVLPFNDMSADKSQEYFSDGLTEELTDLLTKNPKLRVISRTSAFSFKGKEVDMKTIAGKLNVTHVLEGSVRKAGDEVRITAQLIETATDSHLWSETYDRKMENIFAVQDDIASSVAGALKLTLEGAKSPKAKQTGPEAYNAYLQGRYFYDRHSKEDLEKAIGYFKQALQMDPNYARAWVGLSRVHNSQADIGYMPLDQGYEKARKEAQKALELNSNSAEAYSQLGWISSNYDWNWTNADESFKRALELEPRNAEVIRGAASLAGTLGRFEEAIVLDRRAIDLDPLRVATYYNLGYELYYAERHDEAEAAIRKVLELDPQYPGGYHILGRIYLAQSKFEEAFAEMQKEQEPTWHAFGLTIAFHAMGKKKEADAALATFIEGNQNEGGYQIAEIYAYRGETDKAFEWLERAYKQRDGGLTEMKGDPLLRNIKKDPRYTAFLQKMKLPVD